MCEQILVGGCRGSDAININVNIHINIKHQAITLILRNAFIILRFLTAYIGVWPLMSVLAGLLRS